MAPFHTKAKAPVFNSVHQGRPQAPVVSLSREVVDLATQIRARYGFKAPDSLHLGAAVWSRCEVFLTNDHRLDGFRDLTVEVVDRLQP